MSELLQYECQDPIRRIAVRDHPTLNGIDYFEVLDDDAPPGSPKQQTLLVHCFKPLPALTADNVRIEGGVRVRDIGVTFALPAPAVTGAVASAEELALIASLPDAERVLVVRTDSTGDFSTYRFSIISTVAGPGLTDDFDPQLSSVPFSFKVDCPSEFDCLPTAECPEPVFDVPQIDYLAKDYASLRRLMLDRLALTIPSWVERSPADLGVALVELLAYAGDHLSYFQDAVATEAYLGTARQRISVRRHARLLDYSMHDGANARAWVHFQVGSDGIAVPERSLLLTTVSAPRGALSTPAMPSALAEGPVVFETLHAITLWQAQNEIRFHTWGNERCCLPTGATRATLNDASHALEHLAVGDVLIFEEVRGPESGREVDADQSRRHAVRLTEVTFGEDPAATEDGGLPLRVADVAWDPLDALPFTLCLWDVDDLPVSVAHGNVVLADHGRSTSEGLPEIADGTRYRPALTQGPLTHQWRVRSGEGDSVPVDPQAPAAAAFRLAMEDVAPWVRLVEDDDETVRWHPRRDLLESDRFVREFVVEVDDDGWSHLRFGDGTYGRLPVAGTVLRADYRVGNGHSGNVGAESIAHVVGDSAITDVRNPLPATGGTDPEPSREVRLFAPQAFRRQERAVTESDYAAVAQRHSEVQRAAATRRWTGSWYTVFVTVDRVGGRDVDEEFRTDLRRFLERVRLAGYDLEIDAPRFVPLDIVFTVCVSEGHFRSAVKEALLEAFSNRDLPDRRKGFFHPDNLTFGQPVYLSTVVATAMRIPGVDSVDFDATPPKPNRFQRWGELPAGEIAAGSIDFGRLEIARLDNDPSFPENGKLEFFMEGGS